jgi:hypothetical protein
MDPRTERLFAARRKRKRDPMLTLQDKDLPYNPPTGITGTS